MVYSIQSIMSAQLSCMDEANAQSLLPGGAGSCLVLLVANRKPAALMQPIESQLFGNDQQGNCVL
jgi:hypothetical protein